MEVDEPLLKLAAYEALLLACADADLEPEEQQAIRARLGVSPSLHRHLVLLLFPASLSSDSFSALERGRPAYHALLLLEAKEHAEKDAAGEFAAAALAFAARQQALVSASLASSRRICAPPPPPGEASRPAGGGAAKEGWLERRATRHWLKPWLPRYVRLFPGELQWAQDEEDTKVRSLPLNPRAIVLFETKHTLRVTCDERTVTLRALSPASHHDAADPHADRSAQRRASAAAAAAAAAAADETLHDWAQAIEAAAAASLPTPTPTPTPATAPAPASTPAPTPAPAPAPAAPAPAPTPAPAPAPTPAPTPTPAAAAATPSDGRASLWSERLAGPAARLQALAANHAPPPPPGRDLAQLEALVAYLEGCTAAYMLLRLERCTARLERHAGLLPPAPAPLSLSSASELPPSSVGQLEKLVALVEAH